MTDPCYDIQHGDAGETLWQRNAEVGEWWRCNHCGGQVHPQERDQRRVRRVRSAVRALAAEGRATLRPALDFSRDQMEMHALQAAYSALVYLDTHLQSRKDE